MKKTLLALLVAGAAVNANAAVINGSVGVDNAAGSELILAVYNAATNTTYARDLGITMQQFLAAPTTNLSIAATGSQPSFDASWVWGIYSTDTNAGVTGTGTTATRGSRFLTTSVDSTVGGATLSNSIISSGAAAIDTYIAGMNGAFVPAAGEYNTNPTQTNGELLSTSSNPGNVNDTLQTNVNGKFNHTAVNSVGSSSYFVLAKQEYTKNSGTGSAGTSSYTEFAGKWSLAENGVLTYSAVPIPAAVWLLGSGLVGLVGVSRRREQEQA